MNSRRLMLFWLKACSILLFVVSAAVRAESNYFGLLDFRGQNTDAQDSWLEGGLGPFRSDENDSFGLLGQALIFANWEVNESFTVSGLLTAYDDDGEALGFSELYVKYEIPMGQSYQSELKVGTFFPEISLENVRPGWTSRNTLTNSAINTWIGEEIRISGIQYSLRKDEGFHPDWQVGSSIAITGFNDPSSSLLAWRGWALHDRQLRMGDEIRIANLPTINSDTGFTKQRPYYEPFNEVDDRPGYTYSFFGKHVGGLLVRFYRYDNRGDPEAIEDGQYSWRTRFSHLGLAYPIRNTTRFSVQWLEGDTFMGERPNEFVDLDYRAWYVSLTEKIGKLQLSVRYDDFEIEDHDTTAMDNNNQTGESWVLGVRYDFNPSIAVLGEYLRFEEINWARRYFDLSLENEVDLSQIALQWRF